MNISEIVNIVLVVLSIIIGFAATYFKGNAKINGRVAAYIAEAEATYTDAKSGGVKMQYVVGKLYALLPAAIRPFIPQAILVALAQNIFDKIAEYAAAQLNKAVDKALPSSSAEADKDKAVVTAAAQ